MMVWKFASLQMQYLLPYWMIGINRMVGMDYVRLSPGNTEHSLEIDYQGATGVSLSVAYSLGMVGSRGKPLTSEIYSMQKSGQQHQQQVLVPQRTSCLLSVHKVCSVRNVASKWS